MKNYSIEVISFLIESIISVGTLLSSFPSFPPFGRVRVGAQKKRMTKIILFLVGVTGLEPATAWSQTRNATNCATPRCNKFVS